MLATRIKPSFLFVLILSVSSALGQEVKLLKDVAPMSNSSGSRQSVIMNGSLYFIADDGEHGSELWRSDGDGSNTRMVADINPAPGASSNIRQLTATDSCLFFFADDGDGKPTLFSSDGSREGTFKTTYEERMSSTGGYDFEILGATKTHVYLKAARYEYQITHHHIIAAEDTTFNWLYYEQSTNWDRFRFHEPAFGDSVLFFSYTLTNKLAPTNWYIQVCNGQTSWRSDIIPFGWFSYNNPEFGIIDAHGLSASGDELYFACTNTKKLYRSDGTKANTISIADIGWKSVAHPTVSTPLGIYYFLANEDQIELWEYSKVTGGSSLLGTSKSEIVQTQAYKNGLLMVTKQFFSGYDLWFATSQKGLQLIHSYPEADAAVPPEIVVVNGHAYLMFLTTDKGTVLWQSDGTPESTQLIINPLQKHSVNLKPGQTLQDSTVFTSIGNRLYFSASDENYGNEIHYFDVPESKPGEIKLEIIPNPTKQFLTFGSNQNPIVNVKSIEVLNALGQVVFKQSIDQTSSYPIIDVGILRSGIYFLRLDNGMTAKFIKE